LTGLSAAGGDAGPVSDAELAQLVADQLGLTFVEHHSYYRGLYFVADAQPYRIEIQPNAIPGDHGQDDLYHPSTLPPRRCCSLPARTGTAHSTPTSTPSTLSRYWLRRALKIH